jgi:hypothetical protein
MQLAARHAGQVWRGAAHADGAVAVVPTGLGPLDAVLAYGGVPRGTVTEIRGEPGLGALSLGLRLCVAALQARGDPDSRVAVVDPQGELHAPAVLAAGVPAGALWCLRPPLARACHLGVRLLQTGAFAAVVVDLAHQGPAQPELAVRKLANAAQQAQALVVLLTGAWAHRVPLPLPVAVRMHVCRPPPSPHQPPALWVRVDKQRGVGTDSWARLTGAPLAGPAVVPWATAEPTADGLVAAAPHPTGLWAAGDAAAQGGWAAQQGQAEGGQAAEGGRVAAQGAAQGAVSPGAGVTPGSSADSAPVDSNPADSNKPAWPPRPLPRPDDRTVPAAVAHGHEGGQVLVLRRPPSAHAPSGPPPQKAG